jgi:3-oxoadipate enol-lactonase
MAAHSVDRYFTADGARLRYRDEGSGPAVLLVHGWTLDLEMWNPLTAALRSGYRIVRLDRRGFGLSSGQPDLRRDIADLGALCRLLSLERVSLIGMSQGARVVLGLASAAGTNISCLVLDGPPALTDGAVARDAAGDDEIPLARYTALARTEGIGAFRREWAAHPLVQLRSSEPQARELLYSMIDRYPGHELLQAAAPAGPAPDPIQLESIAVPVLVMTGEYELASRVEAADLLMQRLPCAERAVVAAAGHLPNLDNPVAYGNLVRAFLDRHATALI